MASSESKPWKSSWGVLLFISVGLNLTLLQRMWKCTFNIADSPTSSSGQTKAESPPPLENENHTILLIWFWPFGNHFDLSSCNSKFNIDRCHLTADRGLYSKAHGVLIHHRDIAGDLSNLPTLPRPIFQKWVWMHFESPLNTPHIPGLENLFNVTMNYRRDADITVRERLVLRAQDTEDSLPLKKKDKLVCWIVSNGNEKFDREKYYEELRRHISIDVYGKRFNKPISNEEYIHIISSCKFYLSFENTKNYVDYMTEKLYNALARGSVPVVLGPPRHIYERFVPGDAFIHVDDFTSHKELAKYLLALDKNEDDYLQFFQWRKNFKVKGVTFPQEHACRACQYIREKNDFQVFTNLNKWYWNAN